jgi:hypothetical protein
VDVLTVSLISTSSHFTPFLLTSTPSFNLMIISPWKEAILYMMGNRQNSRYDSIFKKQFFDINQYKHLPLREFIDKLCENFPRYQRFVDGEYQIVPREKQKRFLERIICGEECFHFSEVGSGKTKGKKNTYAVATLLPPRSSACP